MPEFREMIGRESQNGVRLLFSDMEQIKSLALDPLPNVYEDSNGLVGIGTTTPTYELDVVGDIGLDEFLYHNDDPDTYLQFTDDQIDFFAGGLNLLRLDETTQDVVSLGDVGGAGDVDVNINNGQMFVQGSDGRTGIGTITPDASLQIGDGSPTFPASVFAGVNALFIGSDTTGGRLYIEGSTEADLIIVDGDAAADDKAMQLRVAGGVSTFRSLSDAFGVQTNNILVLDHGNGAVGIGTPTPTYLLDVAGDAGFNEFLYHNDDPDTYLQFTDDQIDFFAGGLNLLRLDETTQDVVSLGDVGGAGDVDVNINNGQMFVQGSDGSVGIGTTNTGLNSEGLTIQGPSGGVVQSTGLYTGDGDGTDGNSLILYGVGTPAAITNRERLIIQYSSGGTDYRLHTEANGTGTIRPMQLFTQGNTNQLYLDTNGRVGIDTSNPLYLLHVGPGTDTPLTGGDGINIAINGAASLIVRDNSNNVENVVTSTSSGGSLGTITNHHLFIGTNNQLRMVIRDAGDVGIGVLGIPAAQLHVDQSSTTAAQPVLYLDQADVSEEMIEFNTTIGVGNAIEAVGGKSLTTTHFIKVTLPGALTRYIPAGTIA